jgi:hypothetical protein
MFAALFGSQERWISAWYSPMSTIIIGIIGRQPAAGLTPCSLYRRICS